MWLEAANSNKACMTSEGNSDNTDHNVLFLVFSSSSIFKSNTILSKNVTPPVLTDLDESTYSSDALAALVAQSSCFSPPSAFA